MDEPVYSDTLERLYKSLPEHYRRADEHQNYQLKRFLTGMGEQLREVDDLIERINYTPPEDGGSDGDTSDLVDPHTADAAWLPWLAQILGTTSGRAGDYQNRHELHRSIAGFNAGTKESIIIAAKSTLAGDQYVKIYDHTLNPGSVGSGSVWDLTIETRDTETLRNLFPLWVATTTSLSSFETTVNPNTAYILGSYLQDETIPTWNNRLLVYELSASGTAGWSTTVSSSYKLPVTGGLPYTVMLSTIMLEGPTRGGVLGVSFYDSSEAFVSALETGISITANVDNHPFRVNVPANAEFLSLYLRVDGLQNENRFGIAQIGGRRELDTVWVPETSDPVKTILAAGVKPAGFVLHHGTYASSWDAVQAMFPTMVDWEGHTWQEIEELRKGSSTGGSDGSDTGFGEGGYGEGPFGY